MRSSELRTHIYNIIERIQSEQFLQTLFDFLKTKENEKAGGYWNSLTKEQKEEVLLAYEESEDEQNLLDRDELFKNPE